MEKTNMMSCKEYAKRTGLSAVVLRRFVREGRLPALKIGSGARHKLLFPVAEADAALVAMAKEGVNAGAREH